jgi:hypothetical protein
VSLHPPPHRRIAGALLLAAAVATACGPSPSPEPAAFDGRLLVQTGRPEAVPLLAIDGAGTVTAVPPPATGLRWFAAALDGRLAGVDEAGAILVAGADGATWRPIPLAEVPLDHRAADVRLPGWSPDGRLAVLFGDARTAVTAGVLLADPSTEGTFWLDLPAGLGGYPPTWLDAARLAVPTRDAEDRPTLAIVDVDASRILEVREGVRLLAASADRSTLVLVADDRRTIEVWRPDGWEAGHDTALLARFAAAADGSVVDALALDATGDRLALGIVSADGTTASRVVVVVPIASSKILLERELAPGAPVEALGFGP